MRPAARCQRARVLKHRREALDWRALGTQLRTRSRSAAPSLALVMSVTLAVTLGAASRLIGGLTLPAGAPLLQGPAVMLARTSASAEVEAAGAGAPCRARCG